jgi:hypothetical protein
MPRRKKDEKGKDIPTVREQLFAEGIARGKSQTQAAIDAGYSPRSARTKASQKLAKGNIQPLIQERLSAVKADTNEILSLFAQHLRADFGDFDSDCWNDDGTINWRNAKSRGLSRLIRKVRRKTIPQKNGGEPIIEVEVELHDSQAAARSLADIAGLKQQPRENDADRREKKKYYEALVTRILERMAAEGQDIDRETAVAKIVERDAAAVQYLM